MNSKDLRKRGFSEPVGLGDGARDRIPAKIGVYVIIRTDREIDYPMGRSDIVRIGKCLEAGRGFSGTWDQYSAAGPGQADGSRTGPKLLSGPHGLSWLELPKDHIKQVEKRLLNEFVRLHGQYPPYNLRSR